MTTCSSHSQLMSQAESEIVEREGEDGKMADVALTQHAAMSFPRIQIAVVSFKAN